MTKVEFIIELDSLISKLDKKEREEAISFYVELIEDKVEKGMNEQDAVNSLGDIKELAKEILEDRSSKTDEVVVDKTKEEDSSFERVRDKSMNIFNQLTKKFEDLSLGMKITSIITLVIALPIIVSYLTSIVPLVLVLIMLYLLWSIKNEKHSPETIKSMRTILKVVFIITIIVLIPLLIALYVAPFAIFIGTSLAFLLFGILALLNFAFISVSETLLTIGSLMVGISLFILACMLLTSIYKVLNYILKLLYNEVKKEVA